MRPRETKLFRLPRFARHCLANLRISIFIDEIEIPHVLEVLPRKASAYFLSEPLRKFCECFFPVSRPLPTILFVLDDQAANLVIRAYLKRLDVCDGIAAGRLEHCSNLLNQRSKCGQRACAGDGRQFRLRLIHGAWGNLGDLYNIMAYCNFGGKIPPNLNSPRTWQTFVTKQTLMSQFPGDRDAHTQGKIQYVAEVMQKARAEQ